MKVDRSVIKTEQGTLDVKAAKEIFKKATSTIENLWKILPLSANKTEEVEDDDLLLDSSKPVKLKAFGQGTRAKSFEELHQKLEALKGKKKDYKDKKEKKGLKNRLLKKKKNEERRLKKNLLKKQRAGPEFESKPEITVPKSSRPIYNSEGKMVFSKFDFSNSDGDGTSGMPQKTFTSDPKALLQKLEKRKEKLKKLEESGEIDKVKAIKENLAWQTALDKVEGKKLKDDPTLLAKAIKKNTYLKKKSKKNWAEREESKVKDKELRQKKREQNLDARKKQVKKNKVKKQSKKGRVKV